MPRFSLRSFLFWIIALAALAADAQMVNPAKFTSSFNKLSDTAAEIVFTGTIEPGWHVYSTDVGDDGPTAATFNVDNISGAVLEGPLKAVGNPIRKHDDMFDMEVSYFEHSAKFVQKLKLTGGKYAVEGYLQYGACNDQTCVPPKNVEVKFTGEVPAQAAKNQQTAPAQDKNKNGKKEPDAQQTPQAQSSQVDTKNTAIAVAAAANAEQKALVDGKDGASSVDSKKKEDKESVEDEPDDYSLAYASDSVLTDSMGTGEGTDSISVAAALGEEGLWTPVISELKAFDKGGNANASDSPLWKIFLLGLLGGLVALVTPCVWPIIPMTVSFFLKRSGDKKKGIRDAWIYGLSIVVIYVLLGLLVTGLFGASALNSLSTNAIFNIFFFLLLLVFAASFFGAFELTLPSSWSSAVDSKAEKTGGLIGIFLMAFTLTLVSFSCTGPIIGFLLVEVAADGGSIIAPTVGMLGFAIALALPFTLFALFPSWLKSMPKSVFSVLK